MQYQVTVYVDYLDQNPTIETFSTEWEALDAANELIDNAVQWRVDHSPYSISEKELDAIREEESMLVKIEEVNGFEHDGIWISDKMKSPCGRFDLTEEESIKLYGNR